MNVKQQLLRGERSEQLRENERSTTKRLNTDHQLEFFTQGISVSGCFPILSFSGPYSVGLLPKTSTPSLEFTMSKEMIMFIVTIHNIENKLII
jgi:hypothetical protein